MIGKKRSFEAVKYVVHQQRVNFQDHVAKFVGRVSKPCCTQWKHVTDAFH